MIKRKLNSLSARQKLMLLSAYESGKSRDELCNEYNVPRSTLCRIIQNKDKIRAQCAEGQGKMKRIRSLEYPELEKCLSAWIKQLQNTNVPISGPMIKEKAQEFARSLDISNFCSSNGWLDGFKRRNNLVVKKTRGESNPVDDSTCSQWIEGLPALSRHYSPNDIFGQWIKQPEIVPSTSVDYESGSISNSSNFQVKAEPLDIKPEIDYSQYAGIPDHLEDPLIASVKVEADEEDESIEESDYRITTPIVEYHEPDIGLSEWSNESEKNVSNDPPPAKRKKVTKTKEVHCQVATLQPPKEVSHVLTNDEDEYDIFGQHIASQLRLLPTEIALKAQEELRNVILKIRTNYIKEQESIKELRKDEVVRKDVEEEEENINTENINVKNTEENDTDGRKKVSDKSNKEMNESVIRRRKTAIRTLSESELRRNEELGIFGKQIAIQLRELPTTIALEVQSEIISSVTKKRIEYLRTQRESSAMSHSASDENVTLLRKSPLAEKVVKNTYAY